MKDEQLENGPLKKDYFRLAAIFLSPSIACLLTRYALSPRAVRFNDPINQRLDALHLGLVNPLIAALLSLAVGGIIFFAMAAYFVKNVKPKAITRQRTLLIAMMFLTMLFLVNMGITFVGARACEQILWNYENMAFQSSNE